MCWLVIKYTIIYEHYHPGADLGGWIGWLATPLWSSKKKLHSKVVSKHRKCHFRDPPRSSRLLRSATGAFGAQPYSTPATPPSKILDPLLYPLELFKLVKLFSACSQRENINIWYVTVRQYQMIFCLAKH